jgi:hypothetical protein
MTTYRTKTTREIKVNETTMALMTTTSKRSCTVELRTNTITHFFRYAALTENTGIPVTAYIDELDRVFSLAHKNWASEFYRQRMRHDFYRGDV